MAGRPSSSGGARGPLMPSVVAKSRAGNSADLTKAIMLEISATSGFAPPSRSKSKRVFPASDPAPCLLQAQLSRARCEVESLRGLKTENVSKDMAIHALERKVKELEVTLRAVARNDRTRPQTQSLDPHALTTGAATVGNAFSDELVNSFLASTHASTRKGRQSMSHAPVGWASTERGDEPSHGAGQVSVEEAMSLRQTVDELRSKEALAASEIAALKSELSTVKDKSQSAARAAQKANEALDRELRRSQSAGAALTEQLQKVTHENQGLQALAELQNIEGGETEFMAELHKAKIENLTLNDDLAKSRGQNEALFGELQKKIGESRSLANDLDKLKCESGSWNLQSGLGKSALAEFQRLKEVETQCAAELHKAKVENSALSDELARSLSEKDSFARDLKQSQSTGAALMEELQKVKGENQTLAELQNIKGGETEFMTELHKAKVEISTLIDELAKSRDDKETVSEELQKEIGGNRSLAAELSKIKVEHATLAEELRAAKHAPFVNALGSGRSTSGASAYEARDTVPPLSLESVAFAGFGAKVATGSDEGSATGGAGLGALWGRMKTPRSALSTPRTFAATEQALAAATARLDDTSAKLLERDGEVDRLRKVVAMGQKEIAKLTAQVAKMKTEKQKKGKDLKKDHKPHKAHHDADDESADGTVLGPIRGTVEFSPRASHVSEVPPQLSTDDAAPSTAGGEGASLVVDSAPTVSAETGAPGDDAPAVSGSNLLMQIAAPAVPIVPGGSASSPVVSLDAAAGSVAAVSAWTETIDTASGELYWRNEATGEGAWDRPLSSPIEQSLVDALPSEQMSSKPPLNRRGDDSSDQSQERGASISAERSVDRSERPSTSRGVSDSRASVTPVRQRAVSPPPVLLPTASDDADADAFDEDDSVSIEEKYGLKAAEFQSVREEYDENMVSGLNKDHFRAAIVRLVDEFNRTALSQGASKWDKPKDRDLLKAFELEDIDKSGVVDFGKFVRLYSRVKKGEVKGIGGRGFLGLSLF